MNTDDMLVEQAARNKARNPTAKVFVYRNIVKVIGILTLTLVSDAWQFEARRPLRLVLRRHCRGTLRSESCFKTRRTGVRPVDELSACARVPTSAPGHHRSEAEHTCHCTEHVPCHLYAGWFIPYEASI
jgi:hypothetical protein